MEALKLQPWSPPLPSPLQWFLQGLWQALKGLCRFLPGLRQAEQLRPHEREAEHRVALAGVREVRAEVWVEGKGIGGTSEGKDALACPVLVKGTGPRNRQENTHDALACPVLVFIVIYCHNQAVAVQWQRKLKEARAHQQA